MGDQPDVRYAELAHSVDLASITWYLPNVEFLRRLRDNDPELTKLIICDHVGGTTEYQPEHDEDMGWVGHFIGENTHLQELALCYPFQMEPNDSLFAFFRGVFSRNRSIRKLRMSGIDIPSGDMVQIMMPFLENNANLHCLEIEMCALGGDHILSQIVRSCKSVKELHLINSLGAGGDEPPTRIIKACGTLAQLTILSLDEMNVDLNECKALASLPIFCTLEKLSLSHNWLGEDPDAIHALTRALTRTKQRGGLWGRLRRVPLRGVPKGVALLNSGAKLRALDLSHNEEISRYDMRGLQILAEMLGNPTSNLEELNLLFSGVNDEGANMLARALANNSTLRRLILVADKPFYDITEEDGMFFNEDHWISARGWQAFGDILWNTSSMEATFHSNHTLVSFSRTNNLRFDDDGIGSARRREHDPVDSSGSYTLWYLTSSLEMNRRDNVSTAKSKIIAHYLSEDEDLTDFADMCSIPHFIAWVPRDEPTLLYRFVRSMPVQLLGSGPASQETF